MHGAYSLQPAGLVKVRRGASPHWPDLVPRVVSIRSFWTLVATTALATYFVRPHLPTLAYLAYLASR